MGFFKWAFKMVISIALDAADFVIGRLPGWGTVWDIVLGIFGVLLWGAPGGLQFLEVFDFTDQIDGFIPTLTIAGFMKYKEINED